MMKRIQWRGKMNILTSLKEITEIVDWMRINLKTEKIIKKVNNLGLIEPSVRHG